MRKKLLLFLAAFCTTTIFAQTRIDYNKLSPNLVCIVNRQIYQNKKNVAQHHKDKRVLALISLTDDSYANEFFSSYDCRVEDRIGRIFIASIPISRIAEMSLNKKTERIEAERMPYLAMDITPQQINATPIYAGTGLTQAFTGKGVAAGIIDCYFDFTHPAFLDNNGDTRINYFYDFLWKNEDGTLGRAFETKEEISSLRHSHNTFNQSHGTHVTGIMAGSAVNGKYQGMAPECDIYLADFNSLREDFENPDNQTSAVIVLAFKRIFDRAEAERKPCVINLSSCESITISRQRILEGEALQNLVGPGKIIVAACGNQGHQTAYMEKPAGTEKAGVGIVNGIGGGNIIDMDIVTPANQRVQFDFLSIKLADQHIEGTLVFNTDSIDSLDGDTCYLKTTVSTGDIELKVYKSQYKDERGNIYHIDGKMPNIAYLMLYGALCLLSGDSPAWMYSDLFLSPFTNINGLSQYSYAMPGHSVSWPSTLPFVIGVGATGYKSSFKNIDGIVNNDYLMFAPDKTGEIAKFSSLGPTFDGLTKPDVVAPGMSINSAYNSFSENKEEERKELTDQITYNGNTYYYMAQSGTSMSSPVVAGTIALWLQAKPDLTTEEILDVFAHTCTHPEESLEYPNNTYGYGQIDAYKGLLYVLDLPNSIPSLSDHQPNKAHFHLDGRTLRIDFDVEPDDNISITVYSVKGVKMASAKGCTIDLSQLPQGIYAVELNTGKKETSGSTLIRLD